MSHGHAQGVPFAVTPSGVEHWAQGDIGILCLPVPFAVTPSGVEHAAAEDRTARLMAVPFAVTPSGVEHRLWGMNSSDYVEGAVRSDAVRR